MGQSLVQNYLHIVFSTKYRQSLIRPEIEHELHKYIGGICKELDCPALIVGGYFDHIHILCSLSKKLPLMTLVQKIKANSSKWMKTKDKSLKNFYWQDGYGAFSVNYNKIELVVKYIKNQHVHHKNISFKEEYIQFLTETKVEFDSRFVWE